MKQKKFFGKPKITTIDFHQNRAETLCFLRSEGTVRKHSSHAPRKLNNLVETTIALVIDIKRDISSAINESRLEDGNNNFAQ